MNILVTGGSGFIGSNIVNSLIKLNHDITIIGNNMEAQTPNGVSKVLQLNFNGINWDYLQNKGIDVVFHLAANNDTQDKDKFGMMDANYYAPCELFERLYEMGCKKFIYASSTAVYGNSPAPYLEEDSWPGISTELKPLTEYGLSKKLFDEFAMQFSLEKDISVIGLRYCNVYGPGESHKGKRSSMIYQIIQAIKNNAKPKLFKWGHQCRDWIYIKDVVKANLHALNNMQHIRGIFNCGTGVSTSFNDIVEIINRKFDKMEPPGDAVEWIDNPISTTYQDFTCCNIDKLKTVGFSLDYSIEKGISDYIKCLEY